MGRALSTNGRLISASFQFPEVTIYRPISSVMKFFHFSEITTLKFNFKVFNVHFPHFFKYSTKCLSLVVESLSSLVLLGYPQPSLAGIGVPWVLTGTHRCALITTVASRQSANPFCGWCCLEVMWSWTWSERCVVVNILSDVGTENTHPCSTGNAVHKLSVNTTRNFHDSRSKFPCERLRSQRFAKRSAVLRFVSSLMFALSLSTVQSLCNLAGVVLELLLDEICVPLEVSVS